MNLEQEAQRLLNLISTVSSDIHRMPKDNLDHMLETLNVSVLTETFEVMWKLLSTYLWKAVIFENSSKSNLKIQKIWFLQVFE